MRETVEREPPYAPLIRAIQHLDAVLKQGVVFGCESEQIVLRDEDLEAAVKRVRSLLDGAAHDMERLARSITRVQPSGLTLN